MFGRLKKLFKRTEEQVEEKLAEKEEVEERLEEELEPVKEEPVKEKPKPAPEKKAEKPKPKKELPKKEKIKAQKVAPRPEPEEEPEEELAPEEEVVEEPAPRIEKPPEPEPKRKEEVKLGIRTMLKKAVTRKATLSQEEIDDIAWNFQMGLMESDVGMEVAEAICSRLKEKLTDHEFRDPKGEIKAMFREILIDLLTPKEELDLLEFAKKHEKPVKIVFFGVNGGGKTTTIAKVADMLRKNGLSVVLAAGDTFRAGAIEQLAKHAEALGGVKLVKHEKGGDSAAVVFDAVKHAEANGVDVVLADTSGRMQSDVDLMGEMEKIVRVNKPDLKVFVGDALTGNDAIDQAKKFDEAIGIDGAILAKYDASKGGAALSVAHVTGKPILFLGVGQSYSDLQKFVPEEFIDELL